MDRPHAPIVPGVIEEHFEELDFLWEQRETSLFSPELVLEDLLDIEVRAEAHMDGLRLAGEFAVEMATDALSGDWASAATAGTLVLMDGGVDALAEEVVSALGEADDAPRDGIRIGLRHSPVEGVANRLAQLVEKADLSVRAAAADVLAFHRITVQAGLDELLRCDDAQVQILALGATARLQGPLEETHLAAALAQDDIDLRWAALWAFARVGFPGLNRICRAAALRQQDPIREALAFLGVLGDPGDYASLVDAIRERALAPFALQGLGALGSTAAIPVLIEAMADEALAPAAGEAFQRITGAEDVRAERPEPLTPGEADLVDTLDLGEPDLEPGEEFDEPVDDPPDPERARDWWETNQRSFPTTGCWQSGQDAGDGPAMAGFDELPLQTRRDLFLRARARSGRDVPDLELESRAALQLGRQIAHPATR